MQLMYSKSPRQVYVCVCRETINVFPWVCRCVFGYHMFIGQVTVQNHFLSSFVPVFQTDKNSFYLSSLTRLHHQVNDICLTIKMKITRIKQDFSLFWDTPFYILLEHGTVFVYSCNISYICVSNIVNVLYMCIKCPKCFIYVY